MDKSILRALWGFIAFIPFCYVWGVEGFTWFAFIGTLYFVPIHWIFDKLTKKSDDNPHWKDIITKDYFGDKRC